MAENETEAPKPVTATEHEWESPADNATFQKASAALGDAITEASHLDRGDLVLEVQPGRSHDVCAWLASEGFDYLVQMTAIDFPKREQRFTVLWTMQSVATAELLHVATVIGEDVEIASVVDLWKTANWHERECFDMFGIRFAGHPDLRRILLPEWWEGWPLRKDYPVEGRGEHELVVEQCLRPQG